MALHARRIGTPLGEMALAVDEAGALVALEFCTDRSARELIEAVALPDEPVEWGDAHGAEVVGQLDEYFRGERRAFELPLAPRGTPFQLRVWEQLRRIPYGSTISYGELAERVGKRSATASRAVGQANASNPLAIVVPCHRVVGADGKLTGYAAGLSFKAKLLALEGALAPDALLHPHPAGVREPRPGGAGGAPRGGHGRVATRDAGPGATAQADLFGS